MYVCITDFRLFPQPPPSVLSVFLPSVALSAALDHPPPHKHLLSARGNPLRGAAMLRVGACTHTHTTPTHAHACLLPSA